MKENEFQLFLAGHVAAGRSFFYDRCVGNNGDDLIIWGMESLLNLTNAKLADSPDSADVILMNGGGMFVEGMIQGIEKVRYYTEHYPLKPLCIGPQSFDLKTLAFRDIAKNRVSLLTIFTREEPSYQNIAKITEGLANVQILEDHDLAFYISEKEIASFVQSKRHVLIVERMDGEHKTAGSRYKIDAGGPWGFYHKHVPQFVKDWIRPLRVWLHSKFPSQFYVNARKELKRSHPVFVNLPVYAKDISRKDICTNNEFLQVIADSACVFTNRLHVGIMAARLGKPTYLYEGSYHKCTGIYNRSMQRYSNAKLMQIDS